MKNLVYLLFFCTSLIFSQQKTIDSLTIEFNKAKHDTIKAKILTKIGIAAYYIDFEKAKFYNDSLIKFSQGRTKKYEALGYRMQGTLQLIDGKFIDSEKSYKKGLGIFESIKDTAYQGALVANLATLYARQNQIAKADSMYLKAIDILKNVKKDNQSINCYVNLGINASNANKLELATSYFVKCLKEAEENNNKTYQLYAHGQLGAVYLKRQLFENAEKSLLSGKKIGEEIRDKMGLTSIYNSLGALYDEQQNHKKSLEYFLLSKKSAEDINAKDELATALINTARQYEFLGKFTKSKNMFEDAINLTKSINDSSKVVTSQLNLAGLLLRMKNINEAERSINEANRFMPQIPDNDYFMQYKKISEEYAKLNKKSKAYDFLKKYAITADSLYSKNDVSKIADIEAKYQTEKKEKENLILRNEKSEQELATAKANRLKWIFGIGLFASLASLGIFNYFYRRNKKQKTLIENLQKELHHRVKNNLSIIDTFIEVAKDEFEDEQFSSKLTELQNRIDSINGVHMQLYKNDDVTHLDLKKYIESLSQNIQHSFSSSDVVIEKNISDSLSINPSKSFPIGLIINEFLTNSFKYAFGDGDGKVQINLQDKGSQIQLSLSDNGKGLPSNFNIQTTESFGLRIMKLLSEQLNGSFDLKGDNGVQLKVEFPK